MDIKVIACVVLIFVSMSNGSQERKKRTPDSGWNPNGNSMQMNSDYVPHSYPPYGSMTNANYQAQSNSNPMGYNPGTYSNPNYGYPNYGNSNGGFASAGSSANSGTGGYGYQSQMNNGQYPGINEVNGFYKGNNPGSFGFGSNPQDNFQWMQDRMQANMREQQAQARGSWSTASASINNGGAPPNPNIRTFVNTRIGAPLAGNNGLFMEPSINFEGFRGGGGANVPSHYPYTTPQHNFNLNSRWGNFGSNSGGNSGADGDAWAWGSANVSPQGGFQEGAIGPVSPGIDSRFAEEVPSSGSDGSGSYGTFSSSSSSSQMGPDGKMITSKVVTTGVNDNGKISTKTVHDP